MVINFYKFFSFIFRRILQCFIDFIVYTGLHPFIDKNKISKLKFKKENYKRCFIIGSGPSIKNQDLSYLKDDFTIVHNAFYLIRKNYSFTPSLYVIEDPLPAEDNSVQLNQIQDIQFVVPSKLRKFITPRKNVNYINFDYSYLFDPNKKNYNNIKFKFCEDFKYKSFWGGTVVYLSMQIAYYMGFKEIYLMGVDLSYNIPDSAKIENNIIISSEDDPNHFHPLYFGKGKRWHFPKELRMKASIESAVKFLKGRGINVYNLSPISEIEGAQNIDFDRLF